MFTTLADRSKTNLGLGLGLVISMNSDFPTALCPMNERIVVTGLGCISPLGLGIPSTWNALLAGYSGIKIIDNLPISIAGSIPNFEETNSSIASRASQFAIQAAKEAIEDSCLLKGKSIDPKRIGVSIGTSLLSAIPDFMEHAEGKRTILSQSNLNRELSPSKSDSTLSTLAHRASPRFIPKILANTAGSLIAAKYALKGPLSCPSTACATGANSLIDAWLLLKSGLADAMLAGSTEAPLNAPSISGFLAMKALTKSNSPTKASQPFNRDRKGFVIAEGAAVLVLERLSTALDRGARIYCEIGGVGLAGSGSQVSLCEDSVLQCMKGAIEMSRIMEKAGSGCWGWGWSSVPERECNFNSRPFNRSEDEPTSNICTSDEKVEFLLPPTPNPTTLIQPALLINAHATGTQQGDAAELKAIQRLAQQLPLDQVHVCATKASTGHLLAASGALEAAFSVLSLWHGWIPPTLNYQGGEAADHQRIRISSHAQRNSQLKAVLNNSFGFGGVNASVLFLQKQGWN